jgi:medium-chain acyl-[acyl-carrier-protein] hydrolase
MPAHLFVGACPAPHISWSYPPLRSLPDDELLEQVERRYGAIPEAVLQDAEYRQLTAGVLRADFSLIETYVHAPSRQLECPISAFGGMQDDTVAKREIEAWSQHTSGRFHFHSVSGDHLFLQSRRSALLRQISSDLDNMHSERTTI